MATSYDALIVVSFGGPEGKADVMPFLDNVLAGRNVPDDRKTEVARRYELFAGVSPLNQEIARLIAALKQELGTRGWELPIYWGNRNWHPFLSTTVARMAADRIKSALAFVTSAYGSYSSCRQYLENIEAARQASGQVAPAIDKIRAFFNHPAFIAAWRERLAETLALLPLPRQEAALVIFTAHSLPLSMAACSPYQAQLEETARLVATGLRLNSWQLAFQSRSGHPGEAWLEPDLLEVIRQARRKAVDDIVLCPVGFICDNLEILYDLDVEAGELCRCLGIGCLRTHTVCRSPIFINMVADLVLERLAGEPQLVVGSLPPSPGCCPPDCCPRQA